MGDTAYVNRGSYQRVREVYNILYPKPVDLLQPSRFFVREGDLFMWNRKKSKKSLRHFYLFNDILLLCKKKTSKRYFLRIHITLRSPYVTVETINSSAMNSEFRLHCKSRSFILYAFSEDERKEWVNDLDASIHGTHVEERGIATDDVARDVGESISSVAQLTQQMKTMAQSTGDLSSQTTRNQSAGSLQSSDKVRRNPSDKPRSKKSRPKSMVEPQNQLKNDPGSFVYTAPTVTNNPFLTNIPVQQVQPVYLTNSPFATNQRQSMVVQTTYMSNPGNMSPRSQMLTNNNPVVTQVNPFATNTPQVNPFATNNTFNPFATNNTQRIPQQQSQPQLTQNPFLTNNPQQQQSPQQQINPFATTGGY